jgi:hypothetical protein
VEGLIVAIFPINWQRIRMPECRISRLGTG